MTGEPGGQDGLAPGRPPGRSGLQAGFERLLALSRLLVLIPVIFLVLDAAASFVYGADILIRTLTEVVGEPAHVGARLGRFLVVMDTFLVGVTLMILAFGFYELFVIATEREGEKFWLPGWLEMHDIEDLKARVVSMLILVAAITFVDRLVEAQNADQVLFLGGGVAVIIIALTAFLWFGRNNPPESKALAVPATAGGPGDDLAAEAVLLAGSGTQPVPARAGLCADSRRHRTSPRQGHCHSRRDQTRRQLARGRRYRRHGDRGHGTDGSSRGRTA